MSEHQKGEMTQKETSGARTNIASPPVPTHRRFEAFFPKNTVAVANTGAQQFTRMEDLDDPVRKTNVNVQCTNQAENLGYRIYPPGRICTLCIDTPSGKCTFAALGNSGSKVPDLELRENFL